jgi:hypothetical protein
MHLLHRTPLLDASGEEGAAAQRSDAIVADSYTSFPVQFRELTAEWSRWLVLFSQHLSYSSKRVRIFRRRRARVTVPSAPTVSAATARHLSPRTPGSRSHPRRPCASARCRSAGMRSSLEHASLRAGVSVPADGGAASSPAQDQRQASACCRLLRSPPVIWISSSFSSSCAKRLKALEDENAKLRSCWLRRCWTPPSEGHQRPKSADARFSGEGTLGSAPLQRPIAPSQH